MLPKVVDHRTLASQMPRRAEQPQQETGQTTLTFAPASYFVEQGLLPADWLEKYLLEGHPMPMLLRVEES